MLLLKGLTRATNNYSIFFKVSLAKEKVTNIRHLVFFGVLDALVVSKSFNASAKNEQRRVDVSGFLLTVASVQGLLDAFRTGQVTERQHRHPRQMRLFLETKKFNLIVNHTFCEGSLLKKECNYTKTINFHPCTFLRLNVFENVVHSHFSPFHIKLTFYTTNKKKKSFLIQVNLQQNWKRK